MTPRLVTVPDAAAMLGFKSRDPVYELVRSGDLEQVHIGRSSRIVVASIDAYVQRLRDPKPVTLRRLPRVAS